MQEQDQDLADPHTVRGQAALSGASIDEHRGQTVHEALGGDSPVVMARLISQAAMEHELTTKFSVIKSSHFQFPWLSARPIRNRIGLGQLYPFYDSLSAMGEQSLHGHGAGGLDSVILEHA